MQLDEVHAKHLTPSSEIEKRHQRLREDMAERGIDAVWLAHTTALYYFTGSVQDAVLIVPADGEPRYLVRKSLQRAVAESPLEAEPYPGSRALYALFGGYGSRLGLDLGAVSAAEYLRLASAVGDAEIVDVTRQLRTQRMVKSAWEVEQIRGASAVARAGFEAIPSVLAPGVIELEVSAAVEAAMRLAGHQGLVRTSDPRFENFGPNIVSGDGTLYPTNISGSLGSAGPFAASAGAAGWRTIRSGETVIADIVGSHNGYFSDNTRVYFVGAELPDAAARAHDFCLECLRRLERLVKPGAVCEAIYDEVDRWAEEAGKPDGFLGAGDNRMKFFGHGVGLEMDELPVIARKITTPLEPGMILAIEPKAYLRGIGPVGVENTYVVTEEGCRSLFDQEEGITLCG
jgi:Xaa-Pro aminopeptidase